MSSTRPRFSIVIPTRERADTLKYSLQTCLEQDFDDYEIVVADNCSGPATREVVEAAASPRIRYLRSDQPLALSVNWEKGVAAAEGEYVTVLGDDDGLMPFALRELHRLAIEHGVPSAIHWERGLYTWPTITVAGSGDTLRLPMTRSTKMQNGYDLLRAASRYEPSLGAMPMIYNSVVRRDLIDRHREIVGRVFPTIYPDIYSGYAFAFLSKAFLSTSVPMQLAGLSAKSNGVATMHTAGPSPIAEEFFRLQEQAGLKHHRTVPNLTLWPVHSDDSLQYARDLLFPDDPEVKLDRKAMVGRYLGAIPDTDPAARANIHGVIRATLADDPDLQAWFDHEPKDQPPHIDKGWRPERFGLHADILLVDTSEFGVRDIAGAVKLASKILGFGADHIVYDQPPCREVVARAKTQTERQLLSRLQAERLRKKAGRKARKSKRHAGAIRRVLAALKGWSHKQV